MEMKKVKVLELSGAALDRAVAKCEDAITADGYFLIDQIRRSYPARYSTEWAQGGPIIQENLLVLSPDPQLGWVCRGYMDATSYSGATPLIAAMRCFVASQLGEEVDVPVVLLD